MTPYRITLRIVIPLLALAGLGALLTSLFSAAPTAAQSDADPTPVGPWSSSAEAGAGAGAGGPGEGQAPTDAEGVPLVSWRVTGSVLKPRAHNVTYTTNGNGNCTYVTAGETNTVWNTPVQLPNGAVVNTLRMYYYDTSASSTTAWFTVYDLYGNIEQEWQIVSVGNLGNSFTDSAQIDHTIDYSIYSYVLNWRPLVTGSTMQLCGFRVFYQPPAFGLSFLPAVHQ
jgi:hypothetical protein